MQRPFWKEFRAIWCAALAPGSLHVELSHGFLQRIKYLFDGLLRRNWIGKSEGARVKFQTENGKSFEVFTTRPDTLFGVTFMVLAPENPLVKEITSAAQKSAIEDYIEKTKSESNPEF